MSVTPTGRGAQIVLDPIGDYAKAARGAYAATLEANLLKRRTDVAAGVTADGNAPDGRTNTGGPAVDFAINRVYALATAGQVVLTGVTTETNLAILRIPGGSLGKNGAIEIKTLWSYTNNANNKTLITRFNPVPGATAGGLTAGLVVATTTASAQTFIMIRNNNATNAQSYFAPTPVTPFGVAGTTIGALAVDTTVDTYVNLNAQLAAGADTITLIHAYAVAYYAP